MKNYSTPVVEKVTFHYQDQVVASPASNKMGNCSVAADKANWKCDNAPVKNKKCAGA